jgi:hypothetical protein
VTLTITDQQGRESPPPPHYTCTMAARTLPLSIPVIEFEQIKKKTRKEKCGADRVDQGSHFWRTLDPR